MKVRDWIDRIEAVMTALGYQRDTRIDFDEPTVAKVYRLAFGALTPAVDTLNDSALGEVVCTLGVGLTVPQTGGNPFEASLELAEATEEVSNALLSLNDEEATPEGAVRLAGAATLQAVGGVLMVGIPLELSYIYR